MWSQDPLQPSHDKVQQNLPGTAWAAELPPAVDPEPETPPLPSSSAHITLMMMDRRQFVLIPSPGSHTNTCCRAASAHQIEQEQQLDVTLRCPWVLELHPQAGSWSQPMPPMTQFHAGKLDYGSIDPLSFPLRFCWWSSERGHLSVPCLLRQLPTHQRAELTSLELLASNQAKQQKYPGTVKNRKVWQTRSVPGYTEHLPNLYSQGLKKGCQHILQTVFYIIFTV